MRETQQVAMDLFIERGFDAVTVDEIARATGVAASTVYRHFGTKEGIVLWDEHDALIVDALEKALKGQPPLRAIRDVFVETLAGRYDDELTLRRIRYIYATELLHAAAVEADFRDRRELTAALERFLSRKNRSAAPLVAGTALLALDAAIEEWQRPGSNKALADLINEKFRIIDHLGTIT
jgi:AcrR family transcriptional regulator